jgi:hypothetical protein
VDECIPYLCDAYRLCRIAEKKLPVGFEPTTMTNWVNARTTELQSPYFSMCSYSIYVYGIIPRYPELYPSISTLLLYVNSYEISTNWLLFKRKVEWQYIKLYSI